MMRGIGIWAAVFVAMATGVAVGARLAFPLPDVEMLYLVVVMISARSGMTPIRSVAGVAEGVPVVGSPRICRIWSGPKRGWPAASWTPWTTSAAPVMMGDADDVPLNTAVYALVDPPEVEEAVSTFSPHA